MTDETKTPRRRGRPRREAARRSIVAATLALLAERGFHATTMDAIAGRAGVAKNTIYRRWVSKEELITEALDELTAPHLHPHEIDDTYTRLLERSRDLARVFADPLVGRIVPEVVAELRRNTAFAVAFADRILRPRRHAVVEDIRRGIDRGELRPDADVDRIADLLVGPQLLPLLFPYDGAADPRPEELLDLIWQGIAPTTART